MALRLLIVILILAVPLELPGCGPFLPEALFHMTRQPETPADFARGQLGILQPTYERLYQVIAYRYLAGVGLNSAEQQAILPAPQPRVDVPAPTASPNPWLAARNQVGGIQALRQLDPYRVAQRPGYFNIYLNCNDDAFRTAASTLERIRLTGAAAVEWIAAQDTVFADCSKGADIPPPTANPQLRADRAYQIASAKFYSEQYDAARQDFQTIAADGSSPWHGMAPYLATRCLIRAGKFREAETALQSVAADPALTRWHAPAKGLLGYVRTRLHPAERMHELALALVKPDSQATIAQDLIDYRLLFDLNTKPQPTDDLTDWVLSFQAGGARALEHWHASPTLPWLVASLQAAGPRDATVPELLAAARVVKPESPAYLSVSYHAVRLMPPDDARALADELLAGNMPTAARNQIRAERMRLARDFDDFLRYAPRRPVAETAFGVQTVDAKEDYLDADATEILNRDVPLALLKQAAAGTMLPDNVRKELQRAISIRTLVLSAPRFDEVFALLQTPGMRPYVDSGYGRYTKDLTQIDPYRDNWWCSPVAVANAFLTSESKAQPFLSAAEQGEAAAEWKKLQSVDTGPDWLAERTLDFARRHPQDPRVPEALYLVVHATRFGCTDRQTGDFSHRAFDLLHQKYPNTDWAKKTPYWFN